MSKLVRASAVVVAAGLAVPLWGVPSASAAAASEPASADGYFSAAGVPDTETSAGKPPNVTAEADGVGPGNLAVAGGQGAEQKVSFLYFGLDSLPLGGSITKAQLTVPLVPADKENVVVAADPAKVRACLAGPEGFGGEHGESLTVAPERLCDKAEAPAKLSADGKSYVFDVTAIAAVWSTANDGLALTAAKGASTAPFQIVFAPGSESSLTYETTEPEDVAPPTLPDTSTDASTDLGGGGGSADLGGGFGGETASSDTGFDAVESPVVPADVPLPAAQPPAAAPPVSIAPAASGVPLTEALRPTPLFWIGALLLGAALTLLSLIMGDPRIPQARTRQSRLTQSLQARERGGARRGGIGASALTT